MGLRRPIHQSMALPSRMRLRIVCLLATAAVLALAVSSVAMASGPVKQGGQANPGGRPTTPLHGKVVDGLPFTGLDVIALAAVALSLTSTGLALRRLSVEDGEPA
jgi:hypothetical protein